MAIKQENIGLEDIETYGKRHGSPQVSRLLSVLGKQRQFAQAWETPVGKEILADVILLAENKLEKIVNEKADDKDRADYRVCMVLLTKFRDKINSYNQNLTRLKEG